MSFTAVLNTDQISADPGVTVALTVEIISRADDVQQFEIEVEGLDPEWVAIPVPTFSLNSRDSQQEKVFLKPLRTSESLAGDYPFVVKVRSLTTGEARSVPGILQVKAFNHLSMEIDPKRGKVSSTQKQCPFEVTIMNLGNTEHNLKLFATDPEDQCTFVFDSEQISIGAGQQKTIEVRASATSSPLLANARLYGFSVSGRDIETPSVVCSTQAQLERRAFLSPASFASVMVFLLLLVAWILMWPKPPTVDSLTLDKMQVNKGEQLTISWRISHAKLIRISINGKQFAERSTLSGSVNFTPDVSGTVSAVAVDGDKSSSQENQSFTVNLPQEAPDPTILAFTITPKDPKVNETLNVHYEVNSAVTKVTLSPPGVELNPKSTDKEITVTRAGEATYTLLAENATGKTVKQTLTIRVADASEASIVKFDATPESVDPQSGAVTLKWQLFNAVRAEISYGTQTETVDATSGEKEFIITTATTFTLTAYDTQGRKVRQQVKVSMKLPDSPPTDPPPTGNGNGG